MFDTPPLTEVATAVVVASTISAVAIFDRPKKRHVLLIWSVLSSIILVALGHAGFGVLLGVAATVVALSRANQQQRWALAVAGLVAVELTLTTDANVGLRLGGLATAAATGSLLWYSYRCFDQAVAVALSAGTALGIYINVPDTEQIAVHAAGLSVIAVLMIVLPSLQSSSVRFETFALIGTLVAAAGASGARGRPAAFIGVVGALGVLVAEPLARLIRPGTRAHRVVLIAVHAGAVFVASRVAGIRDPSSSIPIVLGVFTAAVVVLTLTPRTASALSPRDNVGS